MAPMLPNVVPVVCGTVVIRGSGDDAPVGGVGGCLRPVLAVNPPNAAAVAVDCRDNNLEPPISDLGVGILLLSVSSS